LLRSAAAKQRPRIRLGELLMTLDELEDELDKLSPKARFCLTDERFSKLFPPGRPDYDAMIRAAKFAHEHGCEVKANKQICFMKKNPN
jgi:hypothetical protein